MPDNDIASNKFIFVCGLQRSGTSILTRLLSEHPSISSMKKVHVPQNEAMYLQDVFPNDDAAGGPGRFAFWPEARLTEEDFDEEKGARIRASWSKYWYPSQNYLIEKSPGNLIRTRFLQALSPKSLFVFILRHPIAVTLATKKWSNTIMFSLMLSP